MNMTIPKLIVGDLPNSSTIPGQRAYTTWNLYVQYDLFVLLYSNRFVWRCPTSAILKHYRTNATRNHLDVGVGTGYYVKRCFESRRVDRIGLLDANHASLHRAASRVRDLRPECYLHDVLQKPKFRTEPYSSVGMTYLLHCLPGHMETKLACLDNLSSMHAPTANIFGATILTESASMPKEARRLTQIYNLKGYFNNTEDTLDSLRAGLRSRFTHVTIEVLGCVALFQATNA